MRPTMRLDVYDRLLEARGGGVNARIARVLSDGRRGSVEILSGTLGPVLTRLFMEPLHVIVGGGSGPDGIMADAMQRLAPWAESTLRYIVEYELPIHALRGELTRLEPDRR